MRRLIQFTEVWLIISILPLMKVAGVEISGTNNLPESAPQGSRVLLTIKTANIDSIPSSIEAAFEFVIHVYQNQLWREYATPVHSYTTSHDFISKFEIDYHFEMRQYIDFVLTPRNNVFHPAAVAKSVLGRIVHGGQVDLQLHSHQEHVIFVGRAPDTEAVDKMKPYITVSVENMKSGQDAFLDYLIAGLKFHCNVAIDFADLESPSSRHFVIPPSSSPTTVHMNSYQTTINSVVSLVEDYNRAKLFLVLGFGGRLPPQYTSTDGTMHRIQMGVEDDEGCVAGASGVDGVLEAYRQCLVRIRSNGVPTRLAPIIRTAIDSAQNLEDMDQNYLIALILISTPVGDMQDAKEVIEQSSKLPLSILIVGIGEGDFGPTRKLNAFNGSVKFFDLKSIYNNPAGSGESTFMEEILGDVPGHVLKYKFSRSTPRSN